MAIDIVDFPITNGDFPLRYGSLPEGKYKPINMSHEYSSKVYHH